MTKWTSPLYTKGRINWAGEMILPQFSNETDMHDALEIVNNWRSSHAFPLNTMKMGLLRAAKLIDSTTTIAQRIKRLSSIKLKLTNEVTMKLSRMQDLGGCRAIVQNINHVYELTTYYKKKSRIKHKLVNSKDYIANPKSTGYRGIHLVYKYFSDRNNTHNGLLIEIQIRTRLQHAWATAVEVVGTFKAQSLKSSRGDKDWLKFFELMGNALAIIEKTSLIANLPSSKKKLAGEVGVLAKKLQVISALEAYGGAIKILRGEVESKNAYYYLLKLEPTKGSLSIVSYTRNQLSLAEKEYLDVEKQLDQTQEVVLVSVESFTLLERAYPNYFLDTKQFIEFVRKVLAWE